MNFNGQELKEITKPQIFDPPKKMLVWNKIMDYAITSLVVAIVERMDGICAICHDGEIYPYCAEIPEKPAPRKATWLEVAKWCATGNGLIYDTNRDRIDTGIMFNPDNEHEPIMDELKVRKWGDTEWHTPDVEYMELEVVCRK